MIFTLSPNSTQPRFVFKRRGPSLFNGYRAFTDWRMTFPPRWTGTVLCWPLSMRAELQGVADAQEAAVRS